jgi:hypothetical protein
MSEFAYSVAVVVLVVGFSALIGFLFAELVA